MLLICFPLFFSYLDIDIISCPSSLCVTKAGPSSLRRGEMCLSGYDEKCTLYMYSHAYPNVLNERDPGRQRWAPVGIGPGSLSPHRALISPPPACLSSSSSPFKDSDSHMNYVDTSISGLRTIVSSPGSLLKEGLPNSCFVRAHGRVHYSAPCHCTYSP